MALRIARISTGITHHPLRPERIIVSAGGRHDQSVFLTVRVEDADGVCGYGEAATTPLWSGESAASAQVIVESLLAPALVGATLDHPSEALRTMERLAWANPFAMGALDTAIWDLFARARGEPVTALFANREPIARIPSRISIGAYDITRTVAMAREFYALGIPTLKFKVGVPGMNDAARLRAVRDALGDDPVFTVDYNGAFRSAVEAAAHIESLRPLNVAWFEQPTHRDRIAMMATVRNDTGAPILADESIFTPDDLAEALELQAMDAVALYPGKNGGFTRALAMARTCEDAGIPCVIGSNLETDLGLAAMAALAAGCSAFPLDRMACDVASSLYYQHASVTQPLRFADGSLYLPQQGTGFGVVPVVQP